MPTITTGMFFVARKPPTTGTAPDGAFQLTLLVKDNQGDHKVEPYVVKWTGNAAKNWWQEHHQHLQPGQPLALELHNPRSFVGARGAPETHAVVLRCELAPVAPSWMRRMAAGPTSHQQHA